MLFADIDEIIDGTGKPQTNAGCEFCNDTLKRFPYILAISDIGDCGTVFEPVVCPKCGRRLQQPAEEGS